MPLLGSIWTLPPQLWQLFRSRARAGKNLRGEQANSGKADPLAQTRKRPRLNRGDCSGGGLQNHNMINKKLIKSLQKQAGSPASSSLLGRSGQMMSDGQLRDHDTRASPQFRSQQSCGDHNLMDNFGRIRPYKLIYCIETAERPDGKVPVSTMPLCF